MLDVHGRRLAPDMAHRVEKSPAQPARARSWATAANSPRWSIARAVQEAQGRRRSRVIPRASLIGCMVSSGSWTQHSGERKLSSVLKGSKRGCALLALTLQTKPVVPPSGLRTTVSSTGNPVEVNTPHVPATAGRRGSRAQSLAVVEV